MTFFQKLKTAGINDYMANAIHVCVGVPICKNVCRFRSLLHLELVFFLFFVFRLYKVMDLVLFFTYTDWQPVISMAFVEEINTLFPQGYFQFSGWRLVGCTCVSFLSFCFIDSHCFCTNIRIFWLSLSCSISWVLALWFFHLYGYHYR